MSENQSSRAAGSGESGEDELNTLTAECGDENMGRLELLVSVCVPICCVLL